MESERNVAFTPDEALVLFEWLSRGEDAGEPVSFVHSAERIVFHNLLASLESIIGEVFAANYDKLSDAARDRIAFEPDPSSSDFESPAS